jgi:hypothetical protein
VIDYEVVRLLTGILPTSIPFGGLIFPYLAAYLMDLSARSSSEIKSAGFGA